MVLGTVCLLLVCSIRLTADTGAAFTILTNTKNIILWQNFGTWLMITEDLSNGRTCYFYDYSTKSKMTLKQPMPGSWIPLGSAIKWLMYVDPDYEGLERLMANDVDWGNYYIAMPSDQNQVGCGMTGTQCVYGQYRSAMVGDHYPVDLYNYDIGSGELVALTSSDSEKSQFSNDGNMIVYRAYYGPGNTEICGELFSGGSEVDIADRDGADPSVCGSLVGMVRSRREWL